MIATTLLALALAAPAAPVDREWANQRPSRGGAGVYMDSNVPAVWAGVPDRVRAVWSCIRRHESLTAGHYDAENGVSTASGAGQWLNGTWDGLKHWVKVDGRFVARQYDEAKDAPAWVQDATFLHVYNHGGLHMWSGTSCPGTG